MTGLSRKLMRSLQHPPTAEELERFDQLRGIYTDEEESAMPMPTALMNVVPPDCPKELQDLSFPIFLPGYTTIQNHVLNKLLRNCDRSGCVTVDPNSMSFEIATPSQFRAIVGVLCERRVLVPVRKNKNEYRIQAEVIRTLWLEAKAAAPVLPEIAPEASEIVVPASTVRIPAPAVMATSDPKLKECFDLWQERFGVLTWEEAECIQEQYNTVAARGSNAHLWVLEAIRTLSKKSEERIQERSRRGYFTGIIRNWLIWGFGWFPTQEYDELASTFEDTFDIKLSPRGHSFLGKLMHQYGVLKVMKVLLIRQDQIDKAQDLSLLLVELLAQQLGDFTGQAPLSKKEDIA